MKTILISLLLFFIIFKLINFVFRMLGVPAQPARYQNNEQKRQRPADGNVDINYVPRDKAEKKKDFNGGEYIDYEEVK